MIIIIIFNVVYGFDRFQSCCFFALVHTIITIAILQLSTSFVLETFIHSKEKVRRSNSAVALDVLAAARVESNFPLCLLLQPTMLQWIELLTKQFNNSQAACEVFAVPHFSCYCFFFVCTHPNLLSASLSPSPTLSGFWTEWQTTTGGPCRSSSSVQIR